MSKCTVEDFEGIELARGFAGSLWLRCADQEPGPTTDRTLFINSVGGRFPLRTLIDAGVAPIRVPLEIPESTFRAAIADANEQAPWDTSSNEEYGRALLHSLDFPITPDPKPTNAERLKRVLEQANQEWCQTAITNKPSATELARLLDRYGVKAPEGDR